MALNKANTTFEDPEGDVATAADPAAATRAAAQARLQEAANKREAEKPADEKPSGAVAPVKAGQVTVAKPMVNPLEPLKNAFPVEWDTLRSLKISSGNLVDQQTGKPMGDTAGLELLSFQDQWVIGTGGDDKDKEAAKEHVRYSDDGKVTTRGESCEEYLTHLKTVYPEAKMSKRMVICGALFDIGVKGKKDLPDLQDSLVQISLPPTSKAAFDRYMMDQAFKIGRGLADADGAQRIKIECEPISKGGKDWTQAKFSRYDA